MGGHQLQESLGDFQRRQPPRTEGSMKVSSTMILPGRSLVLEGRYSFIHILDSERRVPFLRKRSNGWVIARLILVKILLQLPQAVEAGVAPKEACDEANVRCSASSIVSYGEKLRLRGRSRRASDRQGKPTEDGIRAWLWVV